MVVPPITSRLFIGRRAELQSLSDCRRAAGAGHGCVVLVGGEAGIGKSRLLGQFLRPIAGSRAPRIAQGECLEHAPRPYGPFRAIFQTLAWALPAGDGPARRVLAHITQEAAGAQSGTAESAGIEKAELFAGALMLLEQIAAKRAVIVAIEDLHWADPATLELFAYLTPRVSGKRIMLVATYRDDELHRSHPAAATIARLMRERTVHRVLLNAFAPPDVRALIDTALEGRPMLPAASLRGVARRCEGNPFFAEELLKEALEQPSARDQSLPFSIRATVAQRLESFSNDDRNVIRSAALLGQRFDTGLLANIAGRDEVDLVPVLERARDLHLIVELGGDPPEYRFRHALTREAIATEMLLVQSRALHGRIAETLETSPHAEQYVERLAHHWWEARELVKSLVYAERAGDAALGLRAYSDAERHFERALDVAADALTRARLLEKLGDAMGYGNAGDRGQRAFELARDIRLARGEYNDAVRPQMKLAIHHLNHAAIEEGLTKIESFRLQYAGELSDLRLAELTITEAHAAQMFFDEPRTARLLSLVAVPLGQLEPATRRLYWLTVMNSHAQSGRVAEWRGAVEHLHAELEVLTPHQRGAALTNIGLTAIFLAEHKVAETTFAEALALQTKWQFQAWEALTRSIVALQDFVCGRIGQARESLTAALSSADMFATRFQLAYTGPFVGIALADNDLVQRCLDDAVEPLVQPRPSLRALLLGSRAAVLAAKEDFDGARRLLCDAVDSLSANYAAMLLLPLAARYVEGPRLAKVRALAAEAAANPQDRVMGATSQLVEAIVAQREGLTDASHLYASDAAGRYRDLGWPLFEAQALEIAGERAKAIAIYRACGSVADVRRLELGPRSGRSHEAGDLLSEREFEVATLVARGLTNRQAADQLCVSIKTIEKHVGSIFHKLGFRTRMELALYMAGERSA
jgi:DNA-binding CsgD family transcriptional regulator